ncbi:MAG: gas vesicle protein GvpG [Acidobacteria bacterium]|nr:gas vesicle protein GvpG [Acidobacteriota bacterium]MBI3654838.1 gas vesicle protein GvpG [Acidobacteriota bacterium]
MFLIDDLIWLSLKGMTGIAQEIHELADRELNDESFLQEKLLEVQLRYEMDEISQADFCRLEEELLARLNAVRQAKADDE